MDNQRKKAQRGEPTILSLDEWTVPLNDDVAQLLAQSGDDLTTVLANMKRPPAETTCRTMMKGGKKRGVRADRSKHVQEAIETIRRNLQPWLAARAIMNRQVKIAIHPVLPDVITIRIIEANNAAAGQQEERPRPRLCHKSLRKPLDGTDDVSDQESSPSVWPNNDDYKVIIVDRLTGEAILRGSHVYVRGVQAASSSIKLHDRVAVYIDVTNNSNNATAVATASSPVLLLRGMQVSQYTGTCIFGGIGIAQTSSRGEMFTNAAGLAVEMIESVGGPLLPPKNALMDMKNNDDDDDTMILQNLPSCLVATALASTVDRDELILDMCACPGGKTSHLASLLHDRNCHIIACDRSRKKISTVQDLFRRQGWADMITCLPIDSRKAVLSKEDSDDTETGRSLAKILQRGKMVDGDNNDVTNSELDTGPPPTRKVKGFPAGSINHILLDPPCSALGLRPKLDVSSVTVASLRAVVAFQQQLIRTAIALLCDYGYMTYSTCTIHMGENEGMVRWVLDTFADCVILVPIDVDLGRPGRLNSPLTTTERHMVRYFDPTDPDLDTMGFFVAKFRKINQNSSHT